jgi:hypothetical protein
MKTRFVVVLALAGLSIADLIKKALFIVKSMSGNLNFTNPNPALAEIGVLAEKLSQAQIAAAGGGKALTAIMHEQEVVLIRDLNALGNYVEVIANNNPENAVSIITGAGMNVKSNISRGTTQFHAEITDVAGEVKLKTAFVRSVIYHWQMSADGINFTEVGVSRKASFLKTGLTPGKYYFRVAIDSNEGLGSWSDVTSIIIS